MSVTVNVKAFTTAKEGEVSNMSLIERSKLARQQYEEGLILINELEGLKAKVAKAEKVLEAHINSIEVVNIEEVKEEIKKQEEYHSLLVEEINFYESKEGIHTPVQEVTSEPIKPPIEKELADVNTYCEKLEQDKRDRKYELNSIEITDKLNSDHERVIDSLEGLFNKGATTSDTEEFILYFNRNYFVSNGVKMKKGNYEALIKTIESKEKTFQGKLEWLHKLASVHAHMFDETCLADLGYRIDELENMPY